MRDRIHNACSSDSPIRGPLGLSQALFVLSCVATAHRQRPCQRAAYHSQLLAITQLAGSVRMSCGQCSGRYFSSGLRVVRHLGRPFCEHLLPAVLEVRHVLQPGAPQYPLASAAGAIARNSWRPRSGTVPNAAHRGGLAQTILVQDWSWALRDAIRSVWLQGQAVSQNEGTPAVSATLTL